MNGLNTLQWLINYAIKVLFFSARNKSCNAVWSNYRSLSNIVSSCQVSCKNIDGYEKGCGYTHMLIPPTKLRTGVDAVDPIDVTSLTYENTLRLGNMGSDYFMFVQPWYHAPRIPVVTGYHMYSYSLDFICLDGDCNQYDRQDGLNNHTADNDIVLTWHRVLCCICIHLGLGFDNCASAVQPADGTRNNTNVVDADTCITRSTDAYLLLLGYS